MRFSSIFISFIGVLVLSFCASTPAEALPCPGYSAAKYTYNNGKPFNIKASSLGMAGEEAARIIKKYGQLVAGEKDYKCDGCPKGLIGCLENYDMYTMIESDIVGKLYTIRTDKNGHFIVETTCSSCRGRCVSEPQEPMTLGCTEGDADYDSEVDLNLLGSEPQRYNRYSGEHHDLTGDLHSVQPYQSPAPVPSNSPSYFNYSTDYDYGQP